MKLNKLEIHMQSNNSKIFAYSVCTISMLVYVNMIQILFDDILYSFWRQIPINNYSFSISFGPLRKIHIPINATRRVPKPIKT